MKYYLAPMEGITGYIYRNAYEKFFHNIDKYFTPFIVANKSRSLKTKELRDVLPENNKNINIVPQILTNDSEAFIITSKRLQQLGYTEVNLNLGCPSGTVVSKNRGSGFLALREELDRFLEEIFKIGDMKISIKTRIGKDRPEEFYELIKIYNKYLVIKIVYLLALYLGYQQIHTQLTAIYKSTHPQHKIYLNAIVFVHGACQQKR